MECGYFTQRKEKAARDLSARDRKKKREKMQEPVAESQGMGLNSLEYQKEILVPLHKFLCTLSMGNENSLMLHLTDGRAISYQSLH